MKKTLSFIVKIVAIVMAVTALACTVVLFWDRIMDMIDSIIDKIEEKRANCCAATDEFEDYDDFADYDNSIM